MNRSYNQMTVLALVIAAVWATVQGDSVRNPALNKLWHSFAIKEEKTDAWLRLNPDGRFVFHYRNARQDLRDTGTYWLVTLPASGDIGSYQGIRLRFDHPEKLGGSKTDHEPFHMALVYEPELPVLTDLLEVSYAPAGEEKRLKRIYAANLEQQEKKNPTPALPPASKGPLTWSRVWSVPSPDRPKYPSGVCVADLDGDGKSEIIAPAKEGGYTIFDARGKKIRFVSTQSIFETVVVGKDHGRAVVVAIGTWDEKIQGRDGKGSILWSYGGDDGIDDICPVKLPDGDVGFGIGYNGDGGVTLISPQGKTLWNAKGFGNATSVAGMSTKSGSRILAVGSDAGIAVLDMSGKRVDTIRDPDAGAVAAGDIDGDGRDEILTLGTTVASGLRLRAWTSFGRKLWGVSGNRANTAASQKPVLTGHFWGHDAQIVNCEWSGLRCISGSGAMLGELRMKAVGGIAVLHQRSGPDLLVVRGNGNLSAYRLRR